MNLNDKVNYLLERGIHYKMINDLSCFEINHLYENIFEIFKEGGLLDVL